MKTKVSYGKDAFSKNNALTLFQDERVGTTDVSVLGFHISNHDPITAHHQSLKRVTQATNSVMNSSNYWLFLATGNSSAQTSVNKYYKLHRLYLKQGYKMPDAPPLDEVLVKTKKGSRWFSAIPISQEEMGIAARILEKSFPLGTNHLACLPTDCTNTVSKIIDKGWEVSKVPDRPSYELIDAITTVDGCLFYLSGFFDDPDKGVTGFGSPSLIKNVMNVLAAQ